MTVSHQQSYTYILECLDGSWYTGWTNNLETRIHKHRQCKGAIYTRVRGVKELVCAFVVADKSTAMKLEYAIKQLSKKNKSNLVADAIAQAPSKILNFDIITVLTEAKNYDAP